MCNTATVVLRRIMISMSVTLKSQVLGASFWSIAVPQKTVWPTLLPITKFFNRESALIVTTFLRDHSLRRDGLPNVPVWHYESCAPTTRLGAASDSFSKWQVVVFYCLKRWRLDWSRPLDGLELIRHSAIAFLNYLNGIDVGRVAEIFVGISNANLNLHL